MSNSFTKRINKEIQLYQKDNFTFSNLILQPSSDLSIWYFVIYNLKDTEYDNGIYLGKVMLPPKYPFKAPDFMFLSESGRFKTNIKICTSFTGFHNDLYSPSWNIVSMCSGLVSFMTDDSTKSESQGIGHLNESSDIRKNIANDSIKNIKQNKIAFSILNEYFKDYFNELKLT
jgi:ubiquitin-protein ligase